MYFICKENSYDFLVYRMLPVNAVFRNLQTNTGTQKLWSFRKDTLCSSFQCAGALTQALTQAHTWRHLNVFWFHPSHWVLKKRVMRTWRRFSILRIRKPRLEKKAVKSLPLVSSEHGIEACTNCTSKALISSLGEEAGGEGTVKQWPIIKHSLPASFSRQGLNCEALTGLPWNSQCRPGWLWTQKSSCLCLCL